MAETRDLKPYDPEEANRQLRSMLQDTVREARHGGKWLVRSHLTVAVATTVLMVCSGVTAWLTYQQIEAVRTSTQQAQQQFNLSQRPWVASTSLEIIDVEIGKKPRAVLRVENKGLTPAKMRTQLYISTHSGLPTEFSYPDVPHTSTVILLPGAGVGASFDHPNEITAQIMAKLDSGELQLYVYGFSEYEDTRGNTYPPTRFCAFWEPKKKDTVLCKNHNSIE